MVQNNRRSKYPWPRWTNGKQHVIHQGVDYTIPTYNMQISLHKRAKADGMTVTTRSFTKHAKDPLGSATSSEGLLFQFYG